MADESKAAAAAKKVSEHPTPAQETRMRAKGKRLIELYWEWVDQGRPVRAEA